MNVKLLITEGEIMYMSFTVASQVGLRRLAVAGGVHRAIVVQVASEGLVELGIRKYRPGDPVLPHHPVNLARYIRPDC